MSRGYNNVIFTCLTEPMQEFVRHNAKSEDDILPLCTYIRQLQAVGRNRPRKNTLTPGQLEKIRNCYLFTIPEPGTNFGIIMCKNFLQPRQQDNFDIKKPKFIIEKRTNADTVFFSHPHWEAEVDRYMTTSKYEMLLSIKTSPIIYLSFMILSNDIKTTSDFVKEVTDNMLRYCICIRLMEISYDAQLHSHTSYFVVYVQKKTEDNFFHQLYDLSMAQSIRMIFTSNRTFFCNRDLNIMNSIIFLYCFLSDRYKPEKENETDDISIYMCTMIATITFELGGKSLKRNGLSKCGMGPLAFVISEAGIMETAKLNGTLDYPNEENTPPKRYNIESTFERIFLNLPIHNGVLCRDSYINPH